MDMTESVTVVYYDSFGNHPDAFYVNEATTENMLGAFAERDIKTIKNITVERGMDDGQIFMTLYTEEDIQRFLERWNLTEYLVPQQ